MNERWDLTTLANVRGIDVYSADGERIGSVQDIYFDDISREPEWIGLGAVFIGVRSFVVPVEGLRYEGDHLQVPFTRERIQNEPDFEPAESLDLEADMALSDYFGIAGDHEHSTRIARPGDDYRGPHF